MRAAFSKALLAVLLWHGAAQAQQQTVTIAALGDSLTQGYGLIEEEGFVPQLQRWLRARGHQVTVLNLGVSGDTTAGGLARVDWALTPGVDAMIVALGGNDLLRGIPPETSRANLDGILQAARARGVAVLLAGLPAPGNFGPDYQREFDAIFPDLAARYDALLVPDFLGGLEAAAGGDRQAVLSAYMQADGIHPNAAGVALVVEALGPRVEQLIERVRTRP